jgi:hypothetical protein
MQKVSAMKPADKCRRKFLRFFPQGFYDKKYLQWERGYKEAAHQQWLVQLNEKEFGRLLKAREFEEVGRRAMRVEAATNLLFSFEKMALRDATRGKGAEPFARGLFEYLHGRSGRAERLKRFAAILDGLPRKQTRVVTWPALTIFPFLAHPETEFYFKPMVTKAAALAYGFPLPYKPPPDPGTFDRVVELAEQVRKDQRSLRPRDMIDVQSFLWVQGSDEYV